MQDPQALLRCGVGQKSGEFGPGRRDIVEGLSDLRVEIQADGTRGASYSPDDWPVGDFKSDRLLVLFLPAAVIAF